MNANTADTGEDGMEKTADTGIVQTDYILYGKIQKLHYRKTSAGIFIYGSSSETSMTNQIERVVSELIRQKIIEPNHTQSGRCFFYRDSEAHWNQIGFEKGKSIFEAKVEWLTSEFVLDEAISDLIEKTIAKPRSKYPQRRNAGTRVMGW